VAGEIPLDIGELIPMNFDNAKINTMTGPTAKSEEISQKKRGEGWRWKRHPGKGLGLREVRKEEGASPVPNVARRPERPVPPAPEKERSL
jgi:hypothetical protein